MAMAIIEKGTSLSMIVIGKTGTGKSATCNTVLQTNEFMSEPGGISTTESCQHMEKCAWGRSLAMIDTPGTMDVRDMSKALDELMKAMDHCPNGVDSLLLAFRCDVRFTEEELTAAEKALNIFGPECYKRAIVVFTHADVFKNDAQKFVQKLSQMRKEIPRFDAILSRLEDRWVMLDNREECDLQVREEQVKKLLSLVEKVSQKNPKRYKRADFDKEREKQRLEQMEKQIEELSKESRARDARDSAEKMMLQQQMMELMAALQVQAREFDYKLNSVRMGSREENLRAKEDQLRQQEKLQYERGKHLDQREQLLNKDSLNKYCLIL